MSHTRIVAQHTVCPCCERTIDTHGFSFHRCLDSEFVVTLNGQFHAVRDSASQARTYIYSISRRHEAAGIEVEIMQDGDPNEDYYAGGRVSDYEREQEQIELEAAAADWEQQQRDYDAAMARLRGLADEQAAHEDQVRAASAAPMIISLIETPLMVGRAA